MIVWNTYVEDALSVIVVTADKTRFMCCGAQCRNSQRSSWSNVQTCLKRMLCSRTVQIHRNTLSVVRSQSGQKSALAPQQCDQKRLVSLGWPLSMSAGCRGFRVVLQVPSERTQPVMDIERGDAIRHMAPFEKIKYEHLRTAASLQGCNIKCPFSGSSTWNHHWLFLHISCNSSGYTMISNVPINNTNAGTWLILLCAHLLKFYGASETLFFRKQEWKSTTNQQQRKIKAPLN